MLDRRFALCHLTTSVWQTSSRRAANATPSHDGGLYVLRGDNW